MPTLTPSYAEFKASASPGDFAGFLKRINFLKDPFRTYRRFRGGPPSVLLESARVSPRMGRYSVVAKDPFLIFKAKSRRVELQSYQAVEVLEADPFFVIAHILKRLKSKAGQEAGRPLAGHGWPPFMGGAVGYFGYEAKNLLEPRLSQKSKDDLGLPDIYLLFFDQGILWDHVDKSSALFANIRVGNNLKRCYESAVHKIAVLEADLRRYEREKTTSPEAPSRARFFPASIDSSLTRSGFMEIVEKAKRYIRQGEIYQANLSQRFSFPMKEEPAVIYERLRTLNPSSFFGYLDAGDFQILSGSPERLVKLENGILETRPIAGTRARGRTLEEDARQSLDLILNEKERAEHIMLVDLERNDLGRVAEYGSVYVDELMRLEDYAHVKHIVSNVQGALRRGLGAMDVLKALFPGGTITGAPKVRCMEIIDELETVARGPYTGSLGYLSFTGNMDMNIIIRSLVVQGERAHLNVGAGIVADSNPEREYEETLYKTESVFNAIFGKTGTDAFLAKRGAGSRIS